MCTPIQLEPGWKERELAKLALRESFARDACLIKKAVAQRAERLPEFPARSRKFIDGKWREVGDAREAD